MRKKVKSQHPALKLKLGMLFFAVSISAAILQGQAPSTSTVTTAQARSLLESSDPRDQAWGAWWASQGKMQELEPQLRKNLEALLQARRADPQTFDAILDAYIQIGTDALPFELVQKIYSRRPEHGLILISEPQRPRAQVDAFLMKLLEMQPRRSPEWIAVADLLLNHHAQSFVASMLRGMKIQLQFLLCDSGKDCTPPQIPQGSVGSIISGIPDPGYPPWPKYSLMKPQNLVSHSGPDYWTFISGPTPATSMIYFRDITDRFGASYGVGSELTPSTAERMAYVSASDPGLKNPITDDVRLLIQWRNHADYETRTEQARQNLIQRYVSMVRQLGDAALLNADEAKELAMPTIETVVNDRRTVKTPL
jgi:hypothetical protein